MLTGDINRLDRDTTLNMMVSELARTHVSRFPIRVVHINLDAVDFMDDRINATVARLNRMTTDKHDSVYELTSFRIKNERYNSGSRGYQTMTTTNLERIRKLLKQYVQPLHQSELSYLSVEKLKEVYENWKSHFNGKYTEALRNIGVGLWSGIDRDTLMRDIINYKKTGTAFTTGTLASLTSDAVVEAFIERDNVRSQPLPCKHVFINPDDTVYLTEWKYDDGLRGIESAASYTNFDEMPEAVRSHVAMLKLVGTGEVVAHIGVRMGATNFWVQ